MHVRRCSQAGLFKEMAVPGTDRASHSAAMAETCRFEGYRSLQISVDTDQCNRDCCWHEFAADGVSRTDVSLLVSAALRLIRADAKAKVEDQIGRMNSPGCLL